MGSSVKYGRVLVAILLVVSAAGLLGGCRWLLQNAGPVPIVVQSNTLVLQWDADSVPIEQSGSATARFDLYFRSFGTAEWEYLKSTDGFQTQTMIDGSELSHGTYEFAVEQVYRSESRSGLHTSLDMNAWPPGGWYIIWQAP